jgi:hypothetical protein
VKIVKKTRKMVALLLTFLLVIPVMMFPSSAAAGAIWTTDIDGSQDQNVRYGDKESVYVNASGFEPGNYWIRVVAPGNTILGTSPSANFVIGSDSKDVGDTTLNNGDKAYKLWNLVKKASNGAQGYDDSPNNGNVYKVEVSASSDFSNSKADNYKVTDNRGEIRGLKYNDENKNGSKDGDETYLNDILFHLFDAQKIFLEDATTYDGGKFEFVGLQPGNYFLKEMDARIIIKVMIGMTEVFPDQDGYIPVTIGDKQIVQIVIGNSDDGKIEGYKFDDLNRNGVWDENEPALAGIVFSLYNHEKAFMRDADPTDITGYFEFLDLDPGHYYLKEKIGDRLITGILIDGEEAFADSNGFISIHIGISETVEVEIGNSDDGKLFIKKFYDENMNGVWDEGENQIWWKFKVVLKDDPSKVILDGILSVAEQNAGLFVDAGKYLVTEYMPVQAGWQRTTPATVPVEIEVMIGWIGLNDETIEDQTAIFGNAFVPKYDAKTIGFWGNKNGEKAFGEIQGALGILTGLNLKNGTGNDFDPNTYTQFKNWLRDANAVEMKYMLSAQLAAAKLNVESGFVSGSVMLTVPTGIDPSGVISVSDLIDMANKALDDPLKTRSELGMLKDALDMFNNNMNYAPLSAPPFYSF